MNTKSKYLLAAGIALESIAIYMGYKGISYLATPEAQEAYKQSISSFFALDITAGISHLFQKDCKQGLFYLAALNIPATGKFLIAAAFGMNLKDYVFKKFKSKPKQQPQHSLGNLEKKLKTQQMPSLIVD